MAGEVTGATLAAIGVVLKETYGKLLHKAWQPNTPLLKWAQRKTTGFDGSTFKEPVHMYGTSGFGMVPEGQALPSASPQGYAICETNVLKLAGRCQITEEALLRTKGDAGAMVDIWKAEQQGLLDSMKTDCNRMLYGDGTGILGFAAGASAAAVQTVKGYLNWPTGAGVGSYLPNGTHSFRERMRLQAGTPATFNAGLQTALRTIMGITKGTSITAGANWNPALATNDILVRGHGVDQYTHNFTREWDGLLGMLSDKDGDAWGALAVQNYVPFFTGKYKNLSRTGVGGATAYDAWKATVKHSNGSLRDVSEEILDDMVASILDRNPGMEADALLMLMCRGMFLELKAMLQGDRRFVAPQEFKGGFKLVAYAHEKDIPMFMDRDAPYHTILFVPASECKLYIVKDFGWADRDGSVIRMTDNTLAWESVAYVYGNWGNSEPFRGGALMDLNQATGFSY